MSLLIQALKKAERAKQALLHDAELAKSSEALDPVLAPAPSGSEPQAMQHLSLAPMAEPEPGRDAPYGFMGAYIPADATQVPPLRSAATPTGSTAAPGARVNADLPGRTAHMTGGVNADLPGRTAHMTGGVNADLPGRPAHMASGVTWRARPDVSTMRVAVLGGIALLIVGGFAYVYWQASGAQGPGARLPMLPMVPMVPMVPASSVANPALLPLAPPELAPLADVQPAMPAASVTPTASETASPRAAAEAPARARHELSALAVADETPARAAARGAASEPGTTAGPGNAVAAAPGGRDIHITRDNAPLPASPSLQGAYQAFNAGDLGAARLQYEAQLRQDPNNRDALLGMAAIALREGQSGNAQARYQRLLELDPNDNDALAALIGLHQGDPVHSESRLKEILQRNPEAGPVLFSLGNLLARQGRWPEAQQVYFRAYSCTPDNADYAFNLAVGLDRLGQDKLALTYYQRALALVSNSPASFERGVLQRRMHELGSSSAP